MNKSREETLQEILQIDPAIKKVHEKLISLSQDQNFLREYHMREMAMSDMTTVVNTAVEKREIEIARNSIKEGATVEFIQKTTGLDRKTIESLNQEK